MNNVRALVLLTGLTLFFLILGDLIAAHAGIFVGLFISIIMIYRSFSFSDLSILEVFNVKHVALPLTNTKVETIVQSLSIKTQLPVPKIYLIPENAPNICSIGRDPEHASIIITTGLIEVLNENELMAVLTREMSQIREHNTFLRTITASIADSVLQLADRAVWYRMIGEKRTSKFNPTAKKILSPISSFIIRVSIPYSIMMDADLKAAKLSGDPRMLALALTKLEVAKQNTTFETVVIRPSMTSLFIINPLSDPKISKMFSRHPSTAERVKFLELMPVDLEKSGLTKPV